MRPASELADPMAVSALPRARIRAPLQSATLAPGVLALTLVAPALDLLRVVEPALLLASAGVLASGLGCAVLLIAWLRFPRTSWLAAASLAALAGFAMRLISADVAAALSLLAVVALGIGGAFAASVAPAEDDRAAVGAPDLLGHSSS
jgi:hypothetical protein